MTKECKWPECIRSPEKRGFCERDYRRACKQKNFEAPWETWQEYIPANTFECAWPECDRSSRTRGFCDWHYRRARKVGNFDTPWNEWGKCVCEQCGADFTSNTPKVAKFCTKSCKNAYFNPKTLEENKARAEAEILADRNRLRPHGVKTCETCRESKPFSDFYPSNREGDGLRSRCKLCHNAANQEARARRLKKHWTAAGVPFDRCIYCQMMTDLTPGDLHGDHVIARKLGGPDVMSNIAPACYACNICKGEDTLEEFLAREFFYEEDREEIRERLAHYGYTFT